MRTYKIKTIFIAVFTLFFTHLTFPQGLNWVESYGGNGNDMGSHIQSDASGNIYVGGTFENVITLGTFTLSSNGDVDAFIYKRNTAGEIVWAKNVGTTNKDFINAFKVDGNGNILVLTSYTAFDPDYLNTVYKFNSAGTIVKTWNDQKYQSIYFDNNNNYYLAASVEVFNSTNSTFTYSLDIDKYNSADVFQNKQNSGDVMTKPTSDKFWFLDFQVDNAGNYYVPWSYEYLSTSTGILVFYTHMKKFDSNMNLLADAVLVTHNAGSPDNQKIIVDENEDVFVSIDQGYIFKFNDILEEIWYVNNTSCKSIVLKDQYIYAVGEFKNNLINLPDTVIKKINGSEVLISKFDKDGYFYNAFQYGGVGTEMGRDIIVDANNNILISGYYNGSLFSSDDWASSVSSSGLKDSFIASLKCDAGYKRFYSKEQVLDKQILFSARFGDHQNDKFTCVAYDNNGHIIVAGQSYNEISLGNDTLQSPQENSNFIAKMDTLGNVIWSKVIDNKNNASVWYHWTKIDDVLQYWQKEHLYTDDAGNINFFTNGVYYKYNAAGTLILEKDDQDYSNFYSDKDGNYYLSYNTYSSGSQTLTVNKYNAANTLQWTYDTIVNHYYSNRPNKLIADESGNVYLTYTYVNYVTAEKKHYYYSYINKIDDSGNHVYSKYIATNERDLTTDSDGNIYSTSLNNNQLSIYKRNADFGLLWVRYIGGTVSYITDINIVDNELIVSATLNDTYIDMGSGINVVKAQGEQITLMKYDLLGNPIDIAAFGSSNPEYVNQIAFDENKNVYIAGSFSGKLRFEFNTLQSVANSNDALLIKLDANFLGTGKYDSSSELAGGIPTFSIDAVNILDAEYFFNTDPGMGNGIPLVLTQSDSATWDFNIPTSGLEPGFHQLTVRVLDDLDNWSVFEHRTFHIQKPINVANKTAKITNGEYFFDVDPGINNGTAFTFVGTDTLDQLFDFNTTDLEAGFHHLFVRFADDLNRWSTFEGRTFYLFDMEMVDSVKNITEAEYFIGTDPGAGKGTKIPLTDSSTFQQIVNLDLTGLLTNDYTLSFRFKDDKGNWSIAQSQSFSVVDCTIPGTAAKPTGNITACSESTEVYSTLGALDATSYEWNINPADAGVVTPTATTASIVWNANFSGDVLITVKGLNDCANGGWSDTLAVTVSNGPSKPETPDGNIIVCATETSTYKTSANFVDSYSWALSPGSAGTMAEKGDSVVITWDATFSGTVTLSVNGENSCGLGTASDNLSVYVSNTKPSDIFLSNDILDGVSPIGTTVATLSSDDTDTGKTISYTLVSGEGDTDNASFTIENSNLVLNTIINYANQTSYSLRIEANDGACGNIIKVFSLAVSNSAGNSLPVDITLSSVEITEKLAIGTLVATLGTVDADETDTHSYTLISGTGDTDNASFSITGNELTTTAVFDYAVKQSYNIRLKTDDGNLGVLEEMVIIKVVNVNEAPGNFTLLNPQSFASVNTLTPTLEWSISIDPDLNDAVNYTVSVLMPGANEMVYDAATATSFTISEPLLENQAYLWKVSAKDSSGLMISNTEGWQTFVVNAENDDPNQFDLVTPTDSSVEVTLLPLFYWENNGDPDMDELSYDIYISTDDQFTETTPITVTNNYYTPSSNLEDNMEYFWKVVATDISSAKGPVTSSSAQFWTNTALEPPSPFFLITPVNESIIESNTIDFVWSSSIDYDPNDFVRYSVLVSSDMEFSNIIFEETSLEDTLSQISGFEDNQTYYWKVIAVDSDNLETNSEINSFFVGTEVTSPNANDAVSCFNGVVPDLYAEGINIKWYSDAELTTLLYEGSSYVSGLTEVGEYMFYATQTLGAVESNAVMVTLSIYELPELPEITENDNVLLAPNAKAWQWFDADLNSIDGAIGQNFTPTVSGIYYVEVWNENECSAISEGFSYIYSGIGESINVQFIVYPNPSNGKFQLSFNEMPDQEDITISVLSVDGKMEFTETIPSIGNIRNHTIDISQAQQGMYILQIKFSNHLINKLIEKY